MTTTSMHDFSRCHRAPADIAAAEALRPVDPIDRVDRRGPGPRDGLPRAQTLSTRPPLARMRAPSALVPAWKTPRLRPARPRRGRRSPSPRVTVGITLGRHHHGQRRLVVPAQIEILQHAVAGGDQRRQQVRHQAQHQHLAFGIAEADIVFDQLRPFGGDHQPGEQHALERRGPRLHRAHGRLDDLAITRVRSSPASSPAPANRRPCRRCSGPCRRRRRACGPAPRPAGSAVSPSHRAKKLASSPPRNSSITTSCAGFAELAAEHHVDGGLGLGHGLGDDHALAGGQAIGLHDDRRALLAHVVLRRLGVGEAAVSRRSESCWRRDPW